MSPQVPVGSGEGGGGGGGGVWYGSAVYAGGQVAGNQVEVNSGGTTAISGIGPAPIAVPAQTVDSVLTVHYFVDGVTVQRDGYDGPLALREVITAGGDWDSQTHGLTTVGDAPSPFDAGLPQDPGNFMVGIGASGSFSYVLPAGETESVRLTYNVRVDDDGAVPDKLYDTSTPSVIRLSVTMAPLIP